MHKSRLGIALPCSGTLDLLLQDGHNEVVLRHEVVLHHKPSETVTQESLVLWKGNIRILIGVVKVPPTDRYRKYLKSVACIGNAVRFGRS